MPTIEPLYFVEKADQCFRLAQRVSSDPSYKEMVAELNALGNEFLRKAVELDTDRDRAATRREH
jgi:hypothetical protein